MLAVIGTAPETGSMVMTAASVMRRGMAVPFVMRWCGSRVEREQGGAGAAGAGGEERAE
jgi:hypothetical protein